MNEAQTPSAEYLAEEKRLREIRNKDWKDSSDSERIEKLKMAFEQFNYINRNIAELQADIHRLKQHSHKENGEVVVSLSSVNAHDVGLAGLASKHPLQ